jgi:hypothetical protein
MRRVWTTICQHHRLFANKRVAVALALWALLGASSNLAQETTQKNSGTQNSGQIQVNWLYGSYVPKEVPLESLNGDMRFKLYIRQTYLTWGIYFKTLCFTLRDQNHDTYPEWGDGFDGFMKRYASRQGEFILQNSVIALGDGALGWEPRYDRCRCKGFWARTRHALSRNFVTYARDEKSLRPQVFPYLGAFTGSVAATTWTPGQNQWQVKGYQAAITQIPVGMGINWISEFAPEITRIIRRNK